MYFLSLCIFPSLRAGQLRYAVHSPLELMCLPRVPQHLAGAGGGGLHPHIATDQDGGEQHPKFVAGFGGFNSLTFYVCSFSKLFKTKIKVLWYFPTSPMMTP